MDNRQQYVAFYGAKLVARGTLREVAAAAKTGGREGTASLLVFNAETSEPVELDLRGTVEEVIARLPETSEPDETPEGTTAHRGPGRPRLGVVAREVTLLPRHWEWLAQQPGGASVTLRKLVEQARRSTAESDRQRTARDSTYRFMFALAGNESGFEEACRALYAGDAKAFERETQTWPTAVKQHARELAAPTFDAASSEV